MTAQPTMYESPQVAAAWADYIEQTDQARHDYAAALKASDDIRAQAIEVARDAYHAALADQDAQHIEAVTAAWKAYWSATSAARTARDAAIDLARSA